MTLVVMRTKAEQALIDQFEAAEASASGSAPAKAERQAAMEAFKRHGLPHRRVEEWKYTDLRAGLKQAFPIARPAEHAGVPAEAVDAALGPLSHLDAIRIVIVDGHYASAFSWNGEPSDGLSVGPLAGSSLSAARAATGTPAGAALALALAFANDGAVVTIDEDATVTKPILIAALHTAAEPRRATTRNVIRLGRGASATIIEAHACIGPAEVQTSVATEIDVGAGARLAHLKVGLEGSRATHLADWRVILGAEARYDAFQLIAGAGLARAEVALNFAGANGRADISGLLLGRDNDHLDATLTIDHAVPRCMSRELFKAVLADRARGVFQGRIVVQPSAQKTDGKMMAQALMLSPDAEFDSKPELEIYADDVVCGHGSTVAELDEDLLFYCRSRGIPLADARQLLIRSFLGEALDKVEDEHIRGALEAIAGDWLTAAR
jgi:Fe-S cluster assembly protein SufD